MALELRTLSLGELAAELEKGQLWSGPVAPITPERARSQVENPRAETGDPVLLLALEGGRVVGYLGLLPDRVFVPGSVGRFAWISTWWADGERGPKGVGAMLLMRALSLWRGRIGVAGFNREARRVYQASGQFLPIREDPGCTLVMRAEAAALARRLRVARLAAEPLSAGVNLVQAVRLRSWRRRALRDGWRLQALNGVDLQTAAFIEAHRRPELSYRGAAELEWILKWPWLRQSRHVVANYAFSATARRFATAALRLLDPAGEPAAFLLLRARDGVLATPFAVFRAADADRVVEAVLAYMVGAGLSRWTVFDPELLAALDEGRWPALALLPATRRVALGRALDAAGLDRLHLHDGEGDGAFA